MTPITKGIATFTTTSQIGWDTTRESRTLVHAILDGPDAVTLRSADARTGSMTLLFDTADEAGAVDVAHIAPAVWTLTDADMPGNTMRYVLAPGTGPRVRYDQGKWAVDVAFREVLP
jgi:hypothetical protein